MFVCMFVFRRFNLRKNVSVLDLAGFGIFKNSAVFTHALFISDVYLQNVKVCA